MKNDEKEYDGILSIYDPEVAKRVYAEERVEERMKDLALELLREGDSIEKIIRATKLPIETIEELQHRLSQ